MSVRSSVLGSLGGAFDIGVDICLQFFNGCNGMDLLANSPLQALHSSGILKCRILSEDPFRFSEK